MPVKTSSNLVKDTQRVLSSLLAGGELPGHRGWPCQGPLLLFFLALKKVINHAHSLNETINEEVWKNENPC